MHLKQILFFQLLQGSQNYQQRLLGLKYLQIVSDELATPRKSEENENGRNRALLTDFSKFLPAVLCQLTGEESTKNNFFNF